MADSKVAVLLEDLRAQFCIFEDGLNMLNEKVAHEFKEVKTDINNLKNEVANLRVTISEFKSENQQEHKLLMQAIKETDTEVQKLKRIK